MTLEELDEEVEGVPAVFPAGFDVAADGGEVLCTLGCAERARDSLPDLHHSRDRVLVGC